ncbi:MAG: hypothetical protein ACLPND_17900 [Candidatus Korobacteraceae bacterium]
MRPIRNCWWDALYCSSEGLEVGSVAATIAVSVVVGSVCVIEVSGCLWAGLPAFTTARRSTAVKAALPSALASTGNTPRAGLDGKIGVVASIGKAGPSSLR